MSSTSSRNHIAMLVAIGVLIDPFSQMFVNGLQVKGDAADDHFVNDFLPLPPQAQATQRAQQQLLDVARVKQE